MAAPELLEEDTFYECLSEEQASNSCVAGENASVLNRLRAAKEAYDGGPLVPVLASLRCFRQ